MSEFEKAVRIALIKKGMTLTQFAEQLDISVSYLYEIMKGTRKADKQKQFVMNALDIKDEV